MDRFVKPVPSRHRVADDWKPPAPVSVKVLTEGEWARSHKATKE